jgi:uncharacterized protein CbrC (UPF0167 family)
MSTLPTFTYHPDPIATGAIEPSELACECCGQSRGFVYVGSTYSVHEVETICPWCIADGSAHAKFDASFSSHVVESDADIAPHIIDEVIHRTPGYVCWQSETWLTHCNDVCEFHGDASIEDVSNASEATKALWMAEYNKDEAGWERVSEDYEPGEDSALYKFVCRHCGLVLFSWDLS